MQPNQKLLRSALAITRWIGSPISIVMHTLAFMTAIYILVANIFPFDKVILILNTAVSLEAIYLALFIQMTVNYTTESIAEVSEDIDEIQEDIDEMQEDVEEIQEDVDEIQEDVDELQEDVEDISEDDKEDEQRETAQKNALETIQTDLRKLMQDIERLKQTR